MSRKIIITGTSKGIGNALAKAFLDDGETVFGCSRSTCEIDQKTISTSILMYAMRLVLLIWYVV
ncbi:hypothetical protein [Campylobacter majalis]|uniref:hypothetical protein n=1 Tax=Campylobacter majalis TaxID=2790656 RepID=UPI003D694786